MTELPIRVLLVETSRDDALTVTEMLTGLGRGAYEVTWLTTVEQAVAPLLDRLHDVCLLGADSGMDDLDTLVAAGVAPPIILLSRAAGRSVERRAILSGASDFLLSTELEAASLALAIRQAIERAETIRALRQSEHLLRAVLDGVGDAIVVVDAEGRFVTVNARASDLFGMSREKLLGRSVFEFAADHDDARERWLGFDRGGAAEGVWEIVRRGERRALEYRAAAGVMPGRHVAICRDITERRRIEALHQWLVSIVEATDDAIIGADCEGRVQIWNRGAERLFGWSAEEVTGQPISIIATPEQQDEQREFIRRVLSGDNVHNHDTVRLTRDGRTIPVSISISRLDDRHGRAAGLSAIIRDITEVKAAQSRMSAADRMASVGTLAAGVAHEINNPLTVIIANLAILEEMLDGPTELELAGEARQAAEMARQIVRDLKVFSRSDEQKRGPLVLQRVVESSLRMVRNELRHRAKVVESYGPAPLVDGNESRLAQVFLNLIVNAAQAIPDARSEDNQVRISIYTDASGDAVAEVADTGVGISPEILPRIFETFFTTKPVGVGTGLGLAICDQIVHAMDGHIEIDSKPGHGTTVRVILPGLSETATVTVEEPPRQPPSSVTRRGRVLVIDDEQVICRTVTRILSRAHDVVAVTSAERALALIRDGETYDVILCDLMMPNMTGMDLHAALTELHPEMAAKVIFLTGGAFTKRAIDFLHDTENLQVDKPFDPLHLIALVNERVG